MIPEGGAEALAFGDGALWVAGGVIGRLSKIDPRTNEVTTPTRDLGQLAVLRRRRRRLCLGGGQGDTLWKISEEGQVVSSTKLAANIADLTYADGAVWASVGDAGTVVRIDPTTDATRTYRLGHHRFRRRRSQRCPRRQRPVGRGRTLTADLKGRRRLRRAEERHLDSNLDRPAWHAVAFNADQVQFHYATCAKLFNYPDASGAAGKRLVPEVAAGWPKVTDGGRTYTFRIRPGYGFSPPSDEPVTAESFRHEIERVPSSSLDRGAFRAACRRRRREGFSSGQAAHVSGITAHGDTLVIRLAEAGGRPADTTRAAGLLRGPGATCPPFRAACPPDPTAGPVLPRRPVQGRVRPEAKPELPRAATAAGSTRSCTGTGQDVADAAAQVAQGKIDYVQEADPALAPNTAAAGTAGRRYRLTANNWTERLALNTSRPLFADPRLRRAVALRARPSRARRALDGGVFQLPTSHLLPPNLAGPAAAAQLPVER